MSVPGGRKVSVAGKGSTGKKGSAGKQGGEYEIR